ncbi:MAG: IMP cyclohydrolase [Desulfovibrio sp.]|jgi:phosphoribosylaminoimidazolecarboxamide formyltransferase/IMP cyclohydrolase|nr:IMP cyclohydrolase [Desulfovibrio sp.]
MEFLPVTRAVLSVTDKDGLVDFAAFLVKGGVELVSTGGTFRTLRESGLPVVQVSEVTAFPEIMGGRVKTLHPAVHGGILADKDRPEHMEEIGRHGIRPFDLVCVNLYNFAGAVRKRLDMRAAIEEIDIGGPCMLRAGAKNYHSVLVVPSPEYYPRVWETLERNAMRAPLDMRRELAAVAFAATAAYDGTIADYIGGNAGSDAASF